MTEVVYKSLDFMGLPDHRVGDDGSVWSRIASTRWGNNNEWKNRKPTSDGLRMIINLGGKTYQVNRLVLLAFVGPCPEGMEGCHNDGDHRNNELGNLRWDSHYANEQDKKRHGRSNIGEKNPSAKLTVDQVKEIRELYTSGKWSFSQLAKKYGITLGTVHPLVHRRTWRNVV